MENKSLRRRHKSWLDCSYLEPSWRSETINYISLLYERKAEARQSLSAGGQ